MEKFFSRRGKFIVHRGCIKHAFPAVSSTGLTARRPDIIYSVSLDPNTRISRVWRRSAGGGQSPSLSLSLQMGGRETKQRRDRIFRWLCNSRRSPRPRRQLGSFFDRCGARNAAPRREISERVGGETSVTFPPPPYNSPFLFLETHTYTLFLYTIDDVSVNLSLLILHTWICIRFHRTKYIFLDKYSGPREI